MVFKPAKFEPQSEMAATTNNTSIPTNSKDMSATQSASTESQDTFMARWGGALKEGFVVIPRALVTRQSTLGLDERELVVLVNLIASWWKDGDDPYPAVRTIAQRMGVSTRTVQRALSKLEAAGYIKRMRNASGNGKSSDLKVTRYALGGSVALIEAACSGPGPSSTQQPAAAATTSPTPGSGVVYEEHL